MAEGYLCISCAWHVDNPPARKTEAWFAKQRSLRTSVEHRVPRAIPGSRHNLAQL